jgi:NitT/TauT family transport system ATP-binding protein
VREAVTLAERVVLFTYRPGRIKREFNTTHLPRPRHIEDEGAISQVREITAELQSEVRLAVEAEYSDGFAEKIEL